jgi:hypothetical protein
MTIECSFSWGILNEQCEKEKYVIYSGCSL